MIPRVFATVLHNLKSPANVGTIIRSHVAFGGAEIVFVGHDTPWKFGKGTQAFSRRLESLVEIVHLSNDDAFFGWSHDRGYLPLAIEISPAATPVSRVEWPARSAIIVGNEGAGLPRAILDRCALTVLIPQFGEAACLNVGVAASIVMHELRRTDVSMRDVVGSKFRADQPPAINPTPDSSNPDHRGLR